MKNWSTMKRFLSVLLTFCMLMSPIAGACADGETVETEQVSDDANGLPAGEVSTEEGGDSSDNEPEQPLTESVTEPDPVPQDAGDNTGNDDEPKQPLTESVTEPDPVPQDAGDNTGNQQEDGAGQQTDDDEQKATSPEGTEQSDPDSEKDGEEDDPEDLPAAQMNEEPAETNRTNILEDNTEEQAQDLNEGASLLNGRSGDEIEHLSPKGPGSVTISSVDPNASAVVVGTEIKYIVQVVSSASYYLYYTWYRDGAAISSGTNINGRINLTPSATGKYKLKVQAYNNDTGSWASDKVSDETLVVAEAFSYTALNVSATEISLGNPITFTPNVRGGSGDYSITYYVYKDNVLVTSNDTTTSTSYVYVPTAPGSYYGVARIKDNLFGTTISKTSATVTVRNALSIDSITASSLMIGIGTTLSYTVNVSGGIAPYTYEYVLYRGTSENDIKAGVTTNIYSSTPALTGIYHLVVTVEDSKGNKVNSVSAETEVVDTLSVTSVKPNYTLTQTNTPILVTVTYTGSPTKYYYEVLCDDEVVYTEEGTSSSFAYTPTKAGTYVIRVTITQVSSLNNAVSLSAQGSSAKITVRDELTAHGVSTESATYMLGTPITFSAIYSGGIGTIDFVFRIYKKISGNWVLQKTVTNQTGQCSYTPTSEGDYKCEMGIKDAFHDTYLYKESDEIEVIQELVFDKVSVNNNVVPVGTNIVFTPVISGGTGNYHFVYCVFYGNDQQTMTNSTASSFSYTPTKAGVYRCDVYVTDDEKTWKMVSSGNVKAVNNIKSISASLDKSAAYKNEPVKISVSTVGTPIQYCYRVFDSSNNMVFEQFSGSPECTFTPASTGNYQVVALAYDEITWVAAAPVNLSVYEPFSYTMVHLSRLSGKVGDSISMMTDAKGGIPTIRYIYCIYNGQNQLVMHQTTDANYTYTFTAPGTYRIAIYAADAKENWIMHEVGGIQVDSASSLGIKSISVSATTANVSDTITYSVSTTGTVKQYIYCVFRNGQQMTMTYSTSSTFNYTIPSGGTYSITVYATDGSSWVNKTADQVTNVSETVLSITAVTPASTEITLGADLKFTTSVSGATGTVKYIHCLFKGKTQLTMTYSSSPVYTYHPKETGRYHLEVYATDNTGIWVFMSSMEVIVKDIPALELSVTANSTDLTIGDTLKVTPTATGGIGSYEYIYCLFRDDIQMTMDRTSASSYTYVMKAAGTYRVDVYCTDSTGKWIMQSSAVITVH